MKLILFLLFSVSFGRDLLLVSVQPFLWTVREIAGDRFEVEVIAPPKADYHTYELKPKDLIKVAKAKVVFVTGFPLGGWERRIEELAKEKVYKLYTERPEDPHLWMSPRRMIRVAERVYRVLSGVEPEGSETFKRNYERVKEELRNLDLKFSRVLESCTSRLLPETHTSLTLLAKDYKLKHIPLSTGGHHGDLLPGRFARFMKVLKEKGLDYVFAPQMSGLAEKLEREKIKVFLLDVRMFGDYPAVMERNLKVIGEALGCGR